ncbi:MAG: hypothetical protein M0026_00970 [Nocardiopsaceae bacterium]|nr:hypothetical protein [Nocardiopsaceae bacterium]
MPVTHGSTPGPEGTAVPFVSTMLTLDELNAVKVPEGSPLSHALRRVTAERRNPRVVTAGFDNRLH